MDEYTKGFLEGLQAAAMMGKLKWKYHLDNSNNDALSEEDREAAFNCAAVLGNLGSDLQAVGARVRRGELDPRKIAAGNADKSYWWATEDGKGRS